MLVSLRRKRPRHARMLRVRPVPACIGAVVLIAGGATFGTFGTDGAQAASSAGTGGDVTIMSQMAREYASRATAVALPAATTPPTPAPPSLAGAPALQAHEIFGFAPYWTLPLSSGFDVSDLTTIVVLQRRRERERVHPGAMKSAEPCAFHCGRRPGCLPVPLQARQSRARELKWLMWLSRASSLVPSSRSGV